MSQVTVRQLAEVVGIPVDRLIEQLGEAGMEFNDPDQGISNKEKMELLQFLRKRHGKGEKDLGGPNRVTLKRRSHEELKVSAGTGRAKTVNVEVRKKRTYVKRSFIEEQEQADPMREEAARKLQESQEARAAEEQRVKDLDCDALAPGHGEIITDPDRIVDWIIAHRLERETKVAAALAANPGLTTHELVPHVYEDVDRKLYGWAERSLLAHLLKLEDDGAALCNNERWTCLTS